MRRPVSLRPARHQKRPVTITADLAFEQASNAAAAAYFTRPAYVSYRVRAHASAPTINRQGDVNRQVDERTSDDTAVLHDLPQGAVTLAHGFPITPTFDALSYFTLTWSASPHHALESYVHDVTPLTFRRGELRDADVIVTSLRAYKATYASDSDPGSSGKTHLELAPFDFVREQSNPDRTFYYSDLYIDNATGLPTTVKFAGSDDKLFELDYTTVQGHWLVGHAHYEETLHGPLRIGRLHVIADANYDQWAFPAVAPDPRLTPLPGATPQPTAPPNLLASPSPSPAASASPSASPHPSIAPSPAGAPKPSASPNSMKTPTPVAPRT